MAHEGPVGRTDCIQTNELVDELSPHSSLRLVNSPTVLAFAQIRLAQTKYSSFSWPPMFLTSDCVAVYANHLMPPGNNSTELVDYCRPPYN